MSTDDTRDQACPHENLGVWFISDERAMLTLNTKDGFYSIEMRDEPPDDTQRTFSEIECQDCGRPLSYDEIKTALPHHGWRSQATLLSKVLDDSTMFSDDPFDEGFNKFLDEASDQCLDHIENLLQAARYRRSVKDGD